MTSAPGTDFGKYDIPHLGVLCRRIRHGRGLLPEDVAQYCGVSNETISRNIERWGKGSHKVFQKYVESLTAPQVNGVTVEQPLTDHQVEMLLTLFQSHKSVDRLQCQLAAIDFETIKSNQRSLALTDMVQYLDYCRMPAVIIDSLWFVHAINGFALRLFGLTPDSAFLQDWTAWHLLAAKFQSSSPVRSVHRYTDLHYPHTVRFFFEDKMTYPYLFTFQIRLLLSRLHQLSEEHNYNFTKWWLQASRCNLPLDPEPLIRTVVFEGEEIRIEGHNPRVEQDVQLPPGYQLGYRVAGWSPADYTANKIFARLRQLPDSGTVYFAADYDRYQAFHVNGWPETVQQIEQWTQAGYCD